jgi:hypothetical protein
MDFKYQKKRKVTQIMKRLQRIPLNLQEVGYQMPHISSETFPTLFGNTSEEEEKHFLN